MPESVSFALLVLRLGVGAVVLAHGIKHLMGRDRTTRWFGAIGFAAPGFQWFASTATEVGVGILLIAGAGTGLAAAGLISLMTVAFWTVHRRAGFFITAFMRDDTEVEGYEYVAVLALVGLALAIAGPGEYAIDWIIELDGVPLAEMLDGGVGVMLAIAAVVLAALQIFVFWRRAPA